MLAVLKTFGDRPSPGLLSFPMPGATMALDFPDRGVPTRRLLGELEAIVVAAGGRLYPAKDAVMTANTFHRGYPRVGEFLPINANLQRGDNPYEIETGNLLICPIVSSHA